MKYLLLLLIILIALIMTAMDKQSTQGSQANCYEWHKLSTSQKVKVTAAGGEVCGL